MVCVFESEQLTRAQQVVAALEGNDCPVMLFSGGEAKGAGRPAVALQCNSRLQRLRSGFVYRRHLRRFANGQPILWIGSPSLFSIAYGSDYFAVVYDVDATRLPADEDFRAWYDHETLLGEASVVLAPDESTYQRLRGHLRDLPRQVDVVLPPDTPVAAVLRHLQKGGVDD